MRTSLVAVLAAASASLLTACPLALQCGGGLEPEDATYRRGNDVVLACANGGFTGTIGGKTIEGRLFDNVVTDGATNAFVADFAIEDGWERDAASDTTLEKMNFACDGLAAQPWWQQSNTVVPVATVLAIDTACDDSRDGAGDHAIACRDLILVCPDTRAIVMPAIGASYDAAYTLANGQLTVTVDTFVPVVDGTYRADGTFVSGKTRWTAQPAAQLGMSCD